ncbi:hypothetical protein K503DRAFT_785194 [Rhizopogon vinicolor AM-OR11-026]|uniref:Uncharacterized protein n=1 Tax=Rhizopogon vinicolor AM-OR11-026 TaxID=1314800 RepID=A0A1B7MRN7_9AGAM|nr:hypothetical protein K503DRAFT_785194 [Rhizopogon vinicolor AM-OR11-026]
MSDYPLAPNSYTIENTWKAGQYVSVGDEDSIVGCQQLLGSTQVWQLGYQGNYATFQAMPPFIAEGKYIAIDWLRRVLVYSETPALFQLESPVVPLEEDSNVELPIGWQLRSGEDGSPVMIANTMIEGVEWKFS